MMMVVTGGSGSGKSEYAEDRTIQYSQDNRIYIATMVAFDEEARQKINRHRRMRREKNFTTIECYTGLNRLRLDASHTVLLDCMSNLVANEMYQEDGAGNHTVPCIVEGIHRLKQQVKNLIIVTNEVASDGIVYDEETMRYIRYLGEINQELARMADEVIEVVYGIPVYCKKEGD
ncbi:bifunctional adenosylcobinamide kinase/adenosylcobinamide-phosphate guanylyltransferase [Anaerosporobacter faecicola]|uniref:bifunctional adenosylcobinamide kinase/adenosylcobinamide-phosphate guanylyltransferase n=1 Tax=Anaerosporobacter faecicola TaxID=2718714 RepID=UPI00143AD411|nr:bifunctional adenosylcobinamide kinase/adenosylcobinamide-phosphate guanylyltransferase [Anaerosporobacter faecicola]